MEQVLIGLFNWLNSSPILATLFGWLMYFIFILSGGILKKMKNSKDFSKYVQTFSDYKKEFVLNEKTNELVETDTEINIQELIQSSVSSCFEKMLEKYMPKDFIMNDKVKDLYIEEKMQSDLDNLLDRQNYMEEIREKYSLPNDWNETQIYDYLSKEHKAIMNRIKNSEVKNDEKEVIKESK